MATDRQLIELAAKAMGRSVRMWLGQPGEEYAVLDDFTNFQPLHEQRETDCDGDALRLATKLRLVISPVDQSIIHSEQGAFTAVYTFKGGARADEQHNCDEMAATRRAIVRAAAELGRAMP